MRLILIHRDADRLDIKKRLVELHNKQNCEGVTVGASEHSVTLPMEIEMTTMSDNTTNNVEA